MMITSTTPVGLARPDTRPNMPGVVVSSQVEADQEAASLECVTVKPGTCSGWARATCTGDTGATCVMLTCQCEGGEMLFRSRNATGSTRMLTTERILH